MKLLNISFLYLFLLLMNTHSFAKAPTIRILTEELFPISYQANDSEEIKGFATDIIRMVMAEAELNYTLEIIPWSRAYSSTINEPNTLLYSVVRLPEREEQLIWLQKIISLNYGLYTSNKTHIDMTFEDVKDMYITVTEYGFSHSTLVKKGFHNYIFIDDFDRISQLVDRDRLEIIFTSSFWYKHNKHNFSKKLYKLNNIDLITSDVDLYFSINKNTDSTVVSKLNKAFKVIIDDGRFDQIINSYQYDQDTNKQ